MAGGWGEEGGGYALVSVCMACGERSPRLSGKKGTPTGRGGIATTTTIMTTDHHLLTIGNHPQSVSTNPATYPRHNFNNLIRWLILNTEQILLFFLFDSVIISSSKRA